MYGDKTYAGETKVAVVGGGWAGCAAAVELARQGKHVTLFESARTLGGRARGVEIEGLQLDNGQHILLGAYSETLRLMRQLGIDFNQCILKLPLQMRYANLHVNGGMDFAAPRLLPAPLHLLIALLRSKGLTWDDKLSLARFVTSARWMGWQLHTDCSVTELLGRFDQTERLTKLMWRPLCIAALNTPPERASAQVFLAVLRDSLGARRAASDMLIPKTDLTALFPLRAAQFIERHGGSIRTGTTVSQITHKDPGWELHINNERDIFQADAIIVATQPGRASALLAEWIDTTSLNALNGLTYEPITTCYLQYAPDVRLKHPFLALIDDPATNAWGQFVFDRGMLCAAHAGLLAVVISASIDAIDLDQGQLAAAIANQLSTVLQLPQLQSPRWIKVISEKRATFSCTPGLIRPANATNIKGLVLAGDYTISDYPATLESAVRSGMAAARYLLS